MGQPEIVLEVECPERNGTVVRSVKFVPFTIERLRGYWEKLKEFDTLFNKSIQTSEDFIKLFVHGENIDNLEPTGLIWEVDDVGIVYMTDMQPGYQCVGHFSFWDRRISGREPLLREMTKKVMKDFGFRRVVARIPLYAGPVLSAVERAGFVKEGRLRKAAERKGEWWDVNIYSMIQEDFDGDF